MQTTCTASAGDQVSFYWRVSSESSDYLKFYIKGLLNNIETVRQRGRDASIIVLAAQIWYLRAVEFKEEKSRVRTFECQADESINMFSLMGYLQEVAAGHAEELGFGFDRLGELGGYWVLSNMRIEIARLPRRNDEVTIRTWPSGYTRTVATREFVGKDRNGSEVFRAGSEWMVMNKQTNEPAEELVSSRPWLAEDGAESPAGRAKAIGAARRLSPGRECARALQLNRLERPRE